MFKTKKLIPLIGFDHTVLNLFAVVLSGVLFPFVFLNSGLRDFKYELLAAIVFGIPYAIVILAGNIHIFYYRKKKFKSKNPSTGLSMKGFIYHFIYTIIASFILANILNAMVQNPFYADYIFKNLSGSILLSGLWIGVYETFFFMNALNMSKQREEKLQRENVESQMEILKNQVKPHFLFNSLNTLTSLIPEDPDLAVDYVQKLSKVYRYVLEIKDQKLIPLTEEINCIKAYGFMLQIRFGNNLIIDIDETGFEGYYHVVPLSLQLLLENAVKHNIISNNKPLQFKIKKDESLHLLVSNNLQVKRQTLPSTGTGLNNIKERYKMLSDETVEIKKDENNFTVKIPLIEIKSMNFESV